MNAPVRQIRLRDGDMRLSLLDIGAATQAWSYRGQPLILGYGDPEAYRSDPYYLGAIVGRLANRVRGARFPWAGGIQQLEPNEAGNVLHGGAQGLAAQRWDLEQLAANRVVARHVSPAGAAGFPAKIRFEMTVTLEEPRLIYDITATPEAPTPVSLAQHNYYCLGAEPGAFQVRVAADRWMAQHPDGTVTGQVAAVADTALDFRMPRLVAEPSGRACDHYLVFEAGADRGEPVAQITGASGLRLSIRSDQPGAQLYDGGGLGAPFAPHAGICFEPSGYPDAVNHPGFPSVVATPEAPYRQVLTLEVGEAG